MLHPVLDSGRTPVLALRERACPLCHSDAPRTILEDVNRREGYAITSRVVECGACRMRYVNPAPTAETLARLYDDAEISPVQRVGPTTPGESGALRRSAKAALHRVNGYVRGHPHNWPDEPGAGRAILDFGCLDGHKLRYWADRGWAVSGIDINRAAIEIARENVPSGEFWRADLLESAAAIDQRFDAIRADNVFEHLLDPVPYLEALVRLLKPQGSLRVFVPNAAAASVRLFGRFSYIYWMPFHLNLFTSSTVVSALERAGLRRITCQTFTPIGSWTHTQRQLILEPGYDRRPTSPADRILRTLTLLNYPGETVAQYLGLGEELIATARAE